MNRRKDMVANLKSKANQMASTLNMSNFANRDSLLGPEIKPADAMNRTTGLDNYGLVGLQRQIMKGKSLYLVQNNTLTLFTLLFTVCSQYGYLRAHMPVKQNKMRALRNWKRQYIVQNILHWQSTKSLTYIPDLLYVLI